MALPGTQTLLVAESGSDAVAFIDLSSGMSSLTRKSLLPVGVGSRPYSLTVTKSGNRAYVANFHSDSMSVLDTATGTEVGRVKVGYGGRAIAVSADDKYAFITTENSNEVVVVDLASNSAVHRVEVGASPRGVALDAGAGKLYVALFQRSTSNIGDRNGVGVVDVASPTAASRVGSIQVGLGTCSVSVLNK